MSARKAKLSERVAKSVAKALPRPGRSRDSRIDHDRRRASTEVRRARERAGRLAEVAAAVLLMLRGYRVLAARQRSNLGEIDLVAVRRRRLAFVEVKLRRDEALAQGAITDLQARRIADAAEQWVWRHRKYRGYEIGLDSVLVVPWRLPRHIENALQPS